MNGTNPYPAEVYVDGEKVVDVGTFQDWHNCDHEAIESAYEFWSGQGYYVESASVVKTSPFRTLIVKLRTRS